MKTAARAALVALLLLTACRGREAAKAGRENPDLAPTSSDDREERNNLASLANGASILDRTGEAYLGTSAVSLIDGNPDWFWSAPPKDMPQTVTIGLPVRTRITSVGFRSRDKGDFHLRTAQIEAAEGDGAFKPLANVTLKDGPDAQLFDVPPTEADRLRVTMLAGPKPGHEVHVETFFVRGQELAQPAPPRLAGSWRMNGREASFAQFGNEVTGAMQFNKSPVHFEGGAVDNRMLRLAWIRGPEYGFGVATVSNDGKRLSGMDWHEDAIPIFFNEAWFGERTGDQAPADDAETFAVSYIRRCGRWPLFGISFRPDGSIDVAASEHALQVVSSMISKARVPLRLVANEFREASVGANHARAQRELDALSNELKRRGVSLANVQLVTAGSEAPRRLPVTQPMRLLYSSVDLEIRR